MGGAFERETEKSAGGGDIHGTGDSAGDVIDAVHCSTVGGVRGDAQLVWELTEAVAGRPARGEGKRLASVLGGLAVHGDVAGERHGCVLPEALGINRIAHCCRGVVQKEGMGV